MEHTQVGDITEYSFVLYCLNHNIDISKPMTNNLPYDFIIDLKGKLLKIQVKTGYNSPSKDGFMFNTRSTSKNYSEVTTKNYEGLIDGFITCYKEIPNKFFYIPIEKATKGTMTMYYGNNPKSNQHWVYDYDFDKICDADVTVA